MLRSSSLITLDKEDLVSELVADLHSTLREGDSLLEHPIGPNLGPVCDWALLLTLSHWTRYVSFPARTLVRGLLQHHLSRSGLLEAAACMDLLESSR